jgi:hypothetical protein
VVDDRVLGTWEEGDRLFRCTMPDCKRKLTRNYVPECPDHGIPMELIEPPSPQTG